MAYPLYLLDRKNKAGEGTSLTLLVRYVLDQLSNATVQSLAQHVQRIQRNLPHLVVDMLAQHPLMDPDFIDNL